MSNLLFERMERKRDRDDDEVSFDAMLKNWKTNKCATTEYRNISHFEQIMRFIYMRWHRFIVLEMSGSENCVLHTLLDTSRVKPFFPDYRDDDVTEKVGRKVWMASRRSVSNVRKEVSNLWTSTEPVSKYFKDVPESDRLLPLFEYFFESLFVRFFDEPESDFGRLLKEYFNMEYVDKMTEQDYFTLVTKGSTREARRKFMERMANNFQNEIDLNGKFESGLDIVSEKTLAMIMKTNIVIIRVTLKNDEEDVDNVWGGKKIPLYFKLIHFDQYTDPYEVTHETSVYIHDLDLLMQDENTLFSFEYEGHAMRATEYVVDTTRLLKKQFHVTLGPDGKERRTLTTCMRCNKHIYNTTSYHCERKKKWTY